MITETNAIGTADGTTWLASSRLRYLGAPLLASVKGAEGDDSAFSMVAQVQGGIPPRREPH